MKKQAKAVDSKAARSKAPQKPRSLRKDKEPRAKDSKATPLTRARKDGLPGKPNDVSWHPVFLTALAEVPDVTAASKAAGVAPKTAYEHRKKFPDFDEAWSEALNQGTDTARGELYRRAVLGWDEPVFQGGRNVGTVRKKSDQLLMFLLKAHAPETYGDKSKVELSGKLTMTDEEVEKAAVEAHESLLLTLAAGLNGQRAGASASP